ncbi:MAG: potassium transporter [Epsilonproteobacteria bacterium]|nr:potassium transporter [Campylobacterota bacterium]
MEIIIAGAGKVGFHLAKTLSIGHNVTIIDKNEAALQRIQESLDILPLKGDLEDSQTYEPFQTIQIDLFIAVTNVDNVNLIATMLADSILDIKRTFVRLQHHFKDVFIIKEKLGVDKIIFPIRLASKGVSSLLDYPKANNIKFFKYTKHKLISIRIHKDFEKKHIVSDKFIKVGIEREKSFFIPQKESEIQPGDLVYLFGDEEEIRLTCKTLDPYTNKITKCVIYGGDELGVNIAKSLLEMGREVKLIEKDLILCEKANEELEGKASIINAKYDSHEIFEEENLSAADIFIATTSNDEFNIIKCLEAKEKGIKKIVAINNDMEYYNLMHTLDIVVVRGPKMSAYNKIMEEISSTNIVIQKWFCGSKAVVFMRKIFEDSPLVAKKIKPLSYPNVKIAFIRDEQLYRMEEKIILKQNDIIVGFTTAQQSAKLKQWIYGL